MWPNSYKLEKYRQAFNLFDKESKKLSKMRPPLDISAKNLLAWHKVSENTLLLHNQMELVKNRYSELQQTWKDLCEQFPKKDNTQQIPQLGP